MQEGGRSGRAVLTAREEGGAGCLGRVAMPLENGRESGGTW